MNTVIWIDLDAAARLLSSRPEELICLIREGLLESKGSRHTGVVVRVDEVERLAAAFKGKKRRGRRPATQNRSIFRGEPVRC
jgi:hypothetical protein